MVPFALRACLSTDCRLRLSHSGILRSRAVPFVPLQSKALNEMLDKVRAVAFDLDNTLWDVDPVIEREQIERLAALRARRDSGPVAAALAAVEARTRTEENLMPAIATAVESYATLGEISDAMRRVFGEHREIVSL